MPTVIEHIYLSMILMMPCDDKTSVEYTELLAVALQDDGDVWDKKLMRI